MSIELDEKQKQIVRRVYGKRVLSDMIMIYAAVAAVLEAERTPEQPAPDQWDCVLNRAAQWHRITWPCDRADFLAWRPRESGEGIEVLAYNYAMLQTPSGGWLFSVGDAPSLEAIGGKTEQPAPKQEQSEVTLEYAVDEAGERGFRFMRDGKQFKWLTWSQGANLILAALEKEPSPQQEQKP